MKYYQVLISAENKNQANDILDHLLKKKLIFGGPIIEGPAQFWWKGDICKMNYSYILTYTSDELKDEMMIEAEKASVEEVCMISLISIEMNKALEKLLEDTFR